MHCLETNCHSSTLITHRPIQTPPQSLILYQLLVGQKTYWTCTNLFRVTTFKKLKMNWKEYHTSAKFRFLTFCLHLSSPTVWKCTLLLCFIFGRWSHNKSYLMNVPGSTAICDPAVVRYMVVHTYTHTHTPCFIHRHSPPVSIWGGEGAGKFHQSSRAVMCS